MEKGERSFTVDALYKGKTKLRMCSCGGRYINNTPSGAAKKAYSQYFRGKSKKSALIVHVRETTNGSDKKIYKYKISKEDLLKVNN